MIKNRKLYNVIAAAFLALFLALFIAPDIAEAKRGSRSFGGSRRSKSYSKSKRSKSTPKSRAAQRKATIQRQKTTPSFGGQRTTMSAAKKKYGAPRKTSTVQGKNEYGSSQRYVMNEYGGYSSGLMRGYMMGSIGTHMMWMPWYGAFWYSRPHYAPAADGSIHVYPPTINYTKIIVIGIIVLLIIYWIYKRATRGKRRKEHVSTSSFG